MPNGLPPEFRFQVGDRVRVTLEPPDVEGYVGWIGTVREPYVRYNDDADDGEDPVYCVLVDFDEYQPDLDSYGNDEVLYCYPLGLEFLVEPPSGHQQALAALLGAALPPRR